VLFGLTLTFQLEFEDALKRRDREASREEKMRKTNSSGPRSSSLAQNADPEHTVAPPAGAAVKLHFAVRPPATAFSEDPQASPIPNACGPHNLVPRWPDLVRVDFPAVD
jgi:hypothetical protein